MNAHNLTSERQKGQERSKHKSKGGKIDQEGTEMLLRTMTSFIVKIVGMLLPLELIEPP